MNSYDRIKSAGEETRTGLLDAGEQVFAEQGFHGASVRAITRLAGANLGAITYHFGSKAALFEAVMLRAVSGMVAALVAAAGEQGPAPDRLERVVRAHFTYLHDHPSLRRLVLQVLLSEALVPDSITEVLRRAFGLVAMVISAGQEEGVFRAGDPRLLAVSVLTQPLMLNTVRPLLRRGPLIDLDDPSVRVRVLDNAIAFVRAGLARTTEA